AIARAHHGSLAREERLVVEELLKSGELPCLVATSSLELGIDMGAVDLVLQVESPKSVTAGLQRIGRAGHNVGDTSKGRIFPKFRADLLECAVVAQRMREGKIETTVVPRNPLDVLAQQIVAMAASADDDDEPLHVDDLHALLLRTHTYAELSRAQLENVLDMLDGRYPSEEFGELRPRIVWDRVAAAPGVPGAVPFWKGDSVGRPRELGEAIGAFARWAVEQDAATLEADYDLDPRAANNLLEFLREQEEATRVIPSERTIVIERFRDEIGD